MYEILFAPVEKDSEIPDTFLDWALLDEFPSITEACESLAGEIQADIWNGESYAYRIIEKGSQK